MSASTEQKRSPGHSLLLWATREERAGTVRLICAEASERVLAGRDETVVAWRGCLDDLPRARPFELLSLGVGRVVLDLTDCGGPWRTEWSELALVAGVTDRLQVAGEPPADAKRPKQVLDADAMPVLRRRSIFGLGGVPDEQTPGLPDHGSPQQRLRTVIRKLAGDHGQAPEPPAAGWSSGALDLVSEGCTACRVCVQSCPTDALALQTAGRRAGLGFDPSLCIGCGKCVVVCVPKALNERGRLGPPALLGEPVLLELFEVRACSRCLTPFRGTGECCPVCTYRVQNPFGSTMPPGWGPST